MKKIIFVSIITLLHALTVNAQCGWIDGFDPNNPSDPGRGICRSDAHYNYAMTQDFNNCAVFFGDRMNALSACLPLDLYAHAYADVSVRIAQYGISLAGWQNGPGNTLPYDGGCGITDPFAHYNYIKVNGAYNSAGLVKNRMVYLSGVLSRQNYAYLYADVTLVMARYGVGVPSPGIVVFNPIPTITTTVITTTTTTTNGTPVIPREPSTPPARTTCALSDADFAQVDAAGKSSAFSDTKMSTLEVAIKYKCLSIAQIRTLSGQFAMGDDKIAFLKMAWDHTDDKANFYTLSNALTFDSDKQELNDFINSHH